MAFGGPVLPLAGRPQLLDMEDRLRSISSCLNLVRPCSRRVAARDIYLVDLENREEVAGRILEPGDVRAIAPVDPLLVRFRIALK